MGIPFDQYQRYNNAKKIVEALRGNQSVRFNILEVGANEHQLLEIFLPNDDITYLDIELPEKLQNCPKYVLGDATDMNFNDSQYDIIVALDVFEHIPVDKREKFISELNRVSKKCFIIAAPFYSAEVEEAEKRLNEIFKVLYGIEYRWLQEHIKNGLPVLADSIITLKKMEIPYSIYEHGNLKIWEKLTKIHFLSVLDEELQNYRGYIDNYYNENIEPFDYHFSSYRKFIVGYKQNLNLDTEVFSTSTIPKENYEKLRELENEFMILYNNKMLKREKDDIVTILKNFTREKETSMLKNIEEITSSKKEDYLQVYTKSEKKYTEEKSIIVSLSKDETIFYKEIKINKDADIEGIRLDPSKKCCVIKLITLKGVSCNGEITDFSDEIITNGKRILDNSIYIFASEDPQMLIEHNIKIKDIIKLVIEIEYITQSPKNIFLLDEVLNETNELRKRSMAIEDENRNSLKLVQDREQIKEYLRTTLEHVNKLEDENRNSLKLVQDREQIKEYLRTTLEHVNKLENMCSSLTIKGRIKRILKKMGFKKQSLLYLVIKNPKLISKGILEAKRSGLTGLKNKIKGKKNSIDATMNYANEQIKLIQQLSPEIVQNEIEKFNNKPRFSIIMPVYNVEVKWLEKAIESIINQSYQYWEICIADDCSTNLQTIKYIDNIKNEKIKIIKFKKNKGISDASNAAAQIATGEYLILMDNDDEMREEALYEVAKSINEHNPDILYSDEDKISVNGERRFPFLKPDWSTDLLYSQMYICHLLVIKKEIFNNVGGFRTEFNGSQDYDLMLRMSELTQNIYHIPKILYSWREIPSSTSMNPNSKPYAHTAGLKALDEHLKRKYGSEAYSQETDNLFVYDARFNLKQKEVKVSIIIPTKDKLELLEPCIESILDKTKYTNYEILILNNNSIENKTYEWFEKIKKEYSNIRVIDAFYEFNWSKLNNNGIKEASGEVYVFLNNDTIIISSDWLERLAENAMREDVGTVGALLLYQDGTIQHAGVVLGMGGWADHVFKGMEPIHFGSPFVSPVINRNVLACTGACLAISKDTINKIGTFDENFIICGSDVEISLRARKYGLNNLYNARVKLYHLESKSRDSFIPQIDFEMSKLHYQEYLDKGDPYYNPQLDFSSTSPRIKG